MSQGEGRLYGEGDEQVFVLTSSTGGTSKPTPAIPALDLSHLEVQPLDAMQQYAATNGQMPPRWLLTLLAKACQEEIQAAGGTMQRVDLAKVLARHTSFYRKGNENYGLAELVRQV